MKNPLRLFFGFCQPLPPAPPARNDPPALAGGGQFEDATVHENWGRGFSPQQPLPRIAFPATRAGSSNSPPPAKGGGIFVGRRGPKAFVCKKEGEGSPPLPFPAAHDVAVCACGMHLNPAKHARACSSKTDLCNSRIAREAPTATPHGYQQCRSKQRCSSCAAI